MAKSLSSILSQIERLQKEAAAIQLEVVARIRKDIEKFGLTAEQLFGNDGVAKRGRTKAAASAAKTRKAAKTAKPPKYADGTGNTWGGMGKRPDWLRQALAAGKSLEEFLIAGTTPAKAKPKAAAARKRAASPRTLAKPRAAATKAKAKAPASRKPRKAAAPAAAS